MTTNLRRTTALALVAFTMIIATGRPKAQAADFAFRFQFGCDPPLNTFDTFKGVYTRTHVGIGFPVPSVTIPLSLSTAQMRAIDEQMERIHFFDYPSQFNGLPALVDEITTISPGFEYQIEVRNGGNTHSVSWRDNTKPLSEEAVRLREFFWMIIGLINEHPDVRRLPHEFPCE